MASVHDVANFFIDFAQKQAENNQGDLITNLRLQKLLYFAQGWHLAIYSKPLFEDDLQAWQFGPVVPSVYNEFSSYGRSGICLQQPVKRNCFSENEYSLLLDVAREYEKYATFALVNMSHQQGAPWDKTPQREIISKKDIKDFFSAQVPLNRFVDSVDFSNVITPVYDSDGIPILPSEFDDDWGDDDD